MFAEHRRKPVKVAVIGDAKVGKTSLVVAATNESFPDACPPVVPPAILPAEYTQEGLPLHIIDTSSNLEERAVLEQTCLSADVILLLFDTARPQLLKRISSYWMPEMRRLGVHVPIILVGTKSDDSKLQDIVTVVQPINKQFREIESCLDCSAKRLDNILEVFYTALKAVLYPVAPVFDPHANDGLGALKPLCIRALKRVFLMNDKDKDGALSDAELNFFQVNCFSTPLQPEELAGIRRVVTEEIPQGVNATGLTLPGFLFLHAMFIERGRLETVWVVLRKYGYDDNLSLSHELQNEVNFVHTPDQVVELTEAARNFLSQRFVEFDRDNDKLLSAAEQSEMFSVAPTGPWRGSEYRGLLVESGAETASLTLPGFLSKWAFMTAHDPVRSLMYFRYLGFEGPAAPLFSISKTRRQERRSETLQRSVLRVSVFLGKDAGKGVLSRGLAGKLDPDAASPPSTSMAAGEVVDGGTSTSRTVILHEYDYKELEALEKVADALAAADVAAFTFDGGDVASLRQAHEMLQRAAHAAGDMLPCLLVAVENEQGLSKDVLAECGLICSELELRQPLSINASSQSDIPAVLQAFLKAAARPEKSLAIPQTAALKAKKKYNRMLRSAILYTTGGVAGGLLCYSIYRWHVNRTALSSPEPSLEISGRSGSRSQFRSKQ